MEYVEPNHPHAPAVVDHTDLGDIAKSSFSASGSDHTRSAMGPSCGISAKRTRLQAMRCEPRTRSDRKQDLPRNRSTTLI